MIFIFSLFVVNDIDSSCYSSDGKTLNKVSDNSSELRISARCETISDNCFKGLKSLISFYFEDNPNLTSIGVNAFRECSNLQSINLSSCTKLKTIGQDAFYECKLVSQIDLPKGLQEIGWGAFNYNEKITSIFIPASVKTLGEFAFSSCSMLTDVSFEPGSSLTKLELWTFAYTKISSFQIPESVTEVDGDVFGGCQFVNLSLHPSNKNFLLDNNVVYSLDKAIIILIGDKQFETYHFPSHVTTIGAYCFDYNSNIVTVVIPNTIKRIENSAFYCCEKLEKFTFLGPVDYIGSYNLISCRSLKLVIFPPSTMKITYEFVTNDNPFSMQFTCKIIFYPKTIKVNANISISDYENTNLIINTDSLIMDFDQTTIFEFWGDNYQDLNVLIPKTVTKIKENSFQNSSFTKLQIDSDSELLSIGNNAFYNCTSLQSIIFPSKLTFLGNSSFENCIQLENVTFRSSHNLTIMKNSFKNCSNLKSVFNMTNVPGFCFSGCNKLSNILFLDGVESIGRNSFQDCSSLTSLSLPSSIKSISDYSFCNCKSLRTIIIPSSCQLESFQLNSVKGCDSLQNISDFQSSKYECALNTIYFSEDENKKQLIYHLSKSIDEEIIIKCDIICKNSFVDCNNVVNISLLPNGVSMIEKSSFFRCINLKYINFPYSVETVQSQSFIECNSLRCPEFENKTDTYLEMIILSGFSRKRLNSCHVKGVTNGLNPIKNFFYHKLQMDLITIIIN
ncbi:antigen BSP-related family [Trichomonas vaginalis G3]|uniref:antigen BSP-related family n=1 Tax=Trichomonas vaginalis (strain ATCC PRA-98 / G3) TaxID=412133 RepID=UPI0021E5311A|nr:antigen BSP-related family [Trichomonas vaginalis G3]KAI5531595.1 antigen BSP-related family [Trichomonas vaginalis G3]